MERCGGQYRGSKIWKYNVFSKVYEVISHGICVLILSTIPLSMSYERDNVFIVKKLLMFYNYKFIPYVLSSK